MNPALYDELACTWKKKITQKVSEHKIHNDLILNFDQKPLGFTCPAKTTFREKNAETVPIGNLDDKRQITSTFVVGLNPALYDELAFTWKKKIAEKFSNTKFTMT